MSDLDKQEKAVDIKVNSTTHGTSCKDRKPVAGSASSVKKKRILESDIENTIELDANLHE